MSNWKQVLLSPSTPILMAIKIIDASSLQIALVVDEGGRLLGTVTDGDVRRGILKGLSLESPINKVMNPKPIIARPEENRDSILEIMKLKQIRQIPVVNESGCVVDLEILEEMLQPRKLDNWVVLMAGGLGSRLKPLTDECPKPLLKVGSKPILENILSNFTENGFYKFYISVNYKADMIKEYFNDGSSWGIEIRYLEEEKRMGTAGALGLLPEKPSESILVMNGDLLTKVSFQNLLDFHLEHKALATMCVREYDLQVPYGVVRIDKQRLVGIDEKPVYHYFVNAGIYVLEPCVLDFVPQNMSFDMPCLFNKLIEFSNETCVFPIREYWLDIGRVDDLQKANGEYGKAFCR